jgi:hypothetical protein
MPRARNLSTQSARWRRDDWRVPPVRKCGVKTFRQRFNIQRIKHYAPESLRETGKPHAFKRVVLLQRRNRIDPATRVRCNSRHAARVAVVSPLLSAASWRALIGLSTARAIIAASAFIPAAV